MAQSWKSLPNVLGVTPSAESLEPLLQQPQVSADRLRWASTATRPTSAASPWWACACRCGATRRTVPRSASLAAAPLQQAGGFEVVPPEVVQARLVSNVPNAQRPLERLVRRPVPLLDRGQRVVCSRASPFSLIATTVVAGDDDAWERRASCDLSVCSQGLTLERSPIPGRAHASCARMGTSAQQL
jgi:hypothetical protein